MVGSTKSSVSGAVRAGALAACAAPALSACGSTKDTGGFGAGGGEGGKVGVVSGGISFDGGNGSMFGVLTGVLLLDVVQNLLTLAQVPSLLTADIDGTFFANGGPGWIASARDTGRLPELDATGLRVGAPVARPGRIVCLGLNYRDHAEETGAPIPERPVVFMKDPATVVGPYDPVLIPRGSWHTDWEVELGVVIGRQARCLAGHQEALDCVAGFTVSHDVSEREFQLDFSPQWDLGKSCETFNPLGPFLVTPDEISDPESLALHLSVNGLQRQHGSTKDMIFQVAEIIRYLSPVHGAQPRRPDQHGYPGRCRARPARTPLLAGRRHGQAVHRRTRQPAPDLRSRLKGTHVSTTFQDWSTGPRITAVETYDIRFPTSRELDGSDAMNPDPGYSAAYVALRTDAHDGPEGHGFTFTIGRGNEIQVAALDALRPHLLGRSVDELCVDPGSVSRDLVGDSQLRWIGPENGVMHMAIGAVANTAWDLAAKRDSKPLWQFLADAEPEWLVGQIDFRYITDALSPDQALTLLRRGQEGAAWRAPTLKERGYPVYTTSPGWLGYCDEKLTRLAKEAVDGGFDQIKLKVGVNIEDDIRRMRTAREAVGPDIRIALDANQRWGVAEAIVTGGGSGIGLATARLLAARGAEVAVLDLKPDAVRPPLRGSDVVDRPSVAAASGRVASDLDNIDILVNNVGIGAIGTVEDNDDAEWERVLGIIVLASAYLASPAAGSVTGTALAVDGVRQGLRLRPVGQ